MGLEIVIEWLEESETAMEWLDDSEIGMEWLDGSESSMESLEDLESLNNAARALGLVAAQFAIGLRFVHSAELESLAQSANGLSLVGLGDLVDARKGKHLKNFQPISTYSQQTRAGPLDWHRQEAPAF
jgi:hypothetical protein